MMRYLFIFLFLPMLCTAQYMREYQVEIDLSAQTDSVELVTIPARCVIEYCSVIIDTTVSNANVFTVKTQQGQATVLTYNFVSETDIDASVHSDHVSVATGVSRDAVVLHYSDLGGDAAVGRVRVDIRWIELY
jgi:hypothetical protein